ncbi:MAG TPA: LysR family transcriptional regulator [Chloroflexota bacterium]|jgi:DNA-binding transcriptional LysR family regulator
MQLHQIELFCAVVERGSFAQAGAESFITPGALRIQVKRLERNLGIKLLRRVPGGMAPTEAGRVLYAAGRAMLDLRETTSRRLADLRQGTAGTVTVGVIHTAPLYYLTEVLRDFGPACPQVKVVVQVIERDKLFDALLQGTVDLGLDWGPVTRAGILEMPLLEEPWVIVAAPQHPLATVPLVSREQLAATPFLGLQVSPQSIEFADAEMRAAGLHRNVVLRLPFQDAVKRLVEAGQGISMMARIAAEREVAAGHLTTLNVEGFALKYTLLLLRAEGHPRAPAVVMFEGFLHQHPRLRRAPEN